MHLVNNETTGSDQRVAVPTNRSDPDYLEGRYHLFTLVWTGADGILYTAEFDSETCDEAATEALEILSSHEGHTDAVLGDENGDEVSLEPLPPICYMINFKTRRASVLRGEKAKDDAEARGFKQVTPKHFVKYLDNARKGFRQKKKVKK